MIKTSLRLVTLMVIVVGLLATTGYAADLNPPSWRGAATSTYQVWNFCTSSTNAAPETFSNMYGQPSADIAVGDYGTGWCYDELMLGTQTGYWDLGMAGSISIDLPSSASASQEIWVQVTYYSGIVPAPLVDIAGGTLIGSSAATLVEPDVLGAWMHKTFMWEVGPAASQSILVSSDLMGGVVDQIVVDANTQVVPEPGSIAGLLMGCSALLFSRRRRS